MKHEEKLKEISKELKTQDGRHASYPYFVVYDRRPIPINPYYSPVTCNAGANERTIFVHSEFEGYEFENEGDLIAHAREEGYIDDDSEQDFIDEIKKLYVQDVDVLRGVFLTERGAKDFLESQAHHLSRPYIYGESFYNNDEMRIVCEAIASLTPQVPPHKNGIGY